MKQRLIELHQQRDRLSQRIAVQRATLARESVPVQVVCESADRALAVVRGTVVFLRRHPAVVAVVAAAFVALKPRRTWRWLGRGVMAWRGWLALRGLLPHAK
jgi:hypothetical protein